MSHDLAKLLRRIAHPSVRDLAWVLLSPPMLAAAPATQRHPLQGSRWYYEPDRLEDWLAAQALDPAALLNWLARASNRRLGLYYERLWQYALARAPDIELLVANLPVRSGGHTLGELDLLIRDPTGVHHCELAVKFYLGLTGSPPERHDSWLGPGGRDRLDIKLDRMHQHQLALSARAEGRATLDELTCEPTQSSLWLGGYLFEPWPGDYGAPAGANPDRLTGHWVSRSQWASFPRDARRWQPLPRSAWLAPALLEQDQLWTVEQCAAWFAGLGERFQPQLLAGLSPATPGRWEETARRFLVPDGWPTSSAMFA